MNRLTPLPFLCRLIDTGSQFIGVLLTTSLILGSVTLPVGAMEIGEDGPQVRELQEQLQRLGYFDLQPTGLFRELTRDAVIRFQQDQGLTPDGIVGAATWSRLRSAGTGGSTLRLGDRGPEVSQLQEQLQAAGFYDGPVTGVYGQLTVEAVKSYQQAQGLMVDGEYGVRTRAVLTGSASGNRGSNPSSQAQNLDNSSLLQRGDQGPEVIALQQQLKTRGFFNGPITGLYGSLTEEAVRSYQLSAGLTPDGIYGRRTQGRLESGSPAGGSLSLRSDPHVLELQRRLQARGFYDGPLDGILGPRTQEAISRAQERYGISPEDIRLKSLRRDRPLEKEIGSGRF